MAMSKSAHRAVIAGILGAGTIDTVTVDPDTGVETPGAPVNFSPSSQLLDAVAEIVSHITALAVVPPGILVSAPPPSGIGATTGPGTVT